MRVGPWVTLNFVSDDDGLSFVRMLELSRLGIAVEGALCSFRADDSIPEIHIVLHVHKAPKAFEIRNVGKAGRVRRIVVDIADEELHGDEAQAVWRLLLHVLSALVSAADLGAVTLPPLMPAE